MFILLTMALFFTVAFIWMFIIDMIALIKAMKEKKKYSKTITIELAVLFLACFFWALWASL